MKSGWVKNHRAIEEWEWYTADHMAHLFQHLIRNANHEDKTWQGKVIKRGQLVTGRIALSEQTGISEQSIRTCLNRLKSTSEITIETTNKFSIITINKYEDYQNPDEADNQVINQQSNQQLTNNQPTTNQQLTTNKNDKNVKNDKKKNKKTGQTSLPVAKTDHLGDMLKEFQEAYLVNGDEYIVLNPGKEREAMGKLAAFYKKKYPDHNSAQALIGMRAFFDNCMQISEPWLRDNMSPSIIISKLNEINKILKNGNQRQTGKVGATDRELAELIARKNNIRR
jgi:hypothetical protein